MTDQTKVRVLVSFVERAHVRELLERLHLRWVEDRKGIFSSHFTYWVDGQDAERVQRSVQPLCKRPTWSAPEVVLDALANCANAIDRVLLEHQISDRHATKVKDQALAVLEAHGIYE